MNKEVINAMKVIHNYCTQFDNCNKCDFNNPTSETCFFSRMDSMPCSWSAFIRKAEEENEKED